MQHDVDPVHCSRCERLAVAAAPPPEMAIEVVDVHRAQLGDRVSGRDVGSRGSARGLRVSRIVDADQSDEAAANHRSNSSRDGAGVDPRSAGFLDENLTVRDRRGGGCRARCG